MSQLAKPETIRAVVIDDGNNPQVIRKDIANITEAIITAKEDQAYRAGVAALALALGVRVIVRGK